MKRRAFLGAIAAVLAPVSACALPKTVVGRLTFAPQGVELFWMPFTLEVIERRTFAPHEICGAGVVDPEWVSARLSQLQRECLPPAARSDRPARGLT